MLSYQTHEFDDIDGNRGIDVWWHVIEPSDHFEIAEQIQSQLEDYLVDEEFPEELDIGLLCDYTNEVIEFTVKVKEYLPYKGD